MIVFFFSVALTNLALGYALALYLHPELVGSESAAEDQEPVRPAAPVASPIASIELAPRPVEPQTAVDDAIDYQTETAAEGATSSNDSPVAEQPAATVAPTPAEPSVSIATEAAEPAPPTAATSSPTEPETPTQVESVVATNEGLNDAPSDVISCIDRLASGLEAYHSQLQTIAGRVEHCVENPDAGAVQGCLRDLRTMNYDYFEKQLEHTAQLAKLADESTTPIATSIDLAVTTQSASISDVDCALIELDPATDALASATQLLAEVTKLLGGCDKLHLALKPNDAQAEPAPQVADIASTASPLAASDAAV